MDGGGFSPLDWRGFGPDPVLEIEMSNVNQRLVRACLLASCLGLLAGCDEPPGINHDSAGQPWIDEDGGTDGGPAGPDEGTEGAEEGTEGAEEGTEEGEGTEGAEEGTFGDPENAAEEGGLGTGGEETG